MSMNWYVNAGDKIHGPFDGSRLRALAAAGKITRSTAVGNFPTGPWKQAAAIRGLFPETTTAPAALISYPPAARQPPSSPPPLRGAAPAFQLPTPGLAQTPGQDHAEPDTDGETQSSDADKKWSTAKVWGGIGGLAGAAVIAFNIGVVVYNGTDAAAINLIKSSMQTTLAQDPDLDKPVKVLEVELKGDGQHRTGTVTVKCGNTPHAVPFTAEVTHVGRDLRTSWAIKGEDKPVSPDVIRPAKRSQTATPVPTKTAPSNTPPPRTASSRQQTARPSPSARSQRNPSVSELKAAEADAPERFLENLSEWQSALAEVSSLEMQLANEESTWEEDVLVIRKLIAAWEDVRTQSKSLRQFAASVPKEQVNDAKKAELFFQILVLTETTAPGLMKQLNAAVSSNGDAARQAAIETYWELSESIGTAMEQLQESE